MTAGIHQVAVRLSAFFAAAMTQLVNLDPREQIGALTGLLGAAFIALGGSFSCYGFLAFLVSNLALIGLFHETRNWGLLFMQLGFTVTSLYGLERCLL